MGRLERQIPVIQRNDGTICCDICGLAIAAKVERPATKNREQAFYCAHDASRYLGWGDAHKEIN